MKKKAKVIQCGIIQAQMCVCEYLWVLESSGEPIWPRLSLSCIILSTFFGLPCICLSSHIKDTVESVSAKSALLGESQCILVGSPHGFSFTANKKHLLWNHCYEIIDYWVARSATCWKIFNPHSSSAAASCSLLVCSFVVWPAYKLEHFKGATCIIIYVKLIYYFSLTAINRCHAQGY